MQKLLIVTVVGICLSLGIACISVAGKTDNNGIYNRVYSEYLPNGKSRKSKNTREVDNATEDNAEINDIPVGSKEEIAPSQETVDDPNPSETNVVGTDNSSDNTSAPLYVSDDPLIFEGICEWSGEGHSLDMQASVQDYLSATWSVTEDVGQKEYIGYAKFKVFDVAIKDGSTEDVVVDIDLRLVDFHSEHWTTLNSQEQAMIFVYDDGGSRCIAPTSCNVNLDDIHSAIHLALIHKYPGGYVIEGDASFLGVFIKARERQDDLQEICGIYEVSEESDAPQDSAEVPQDSAEVPQDSAEVPQETTEVADQPETDISDTSGTDDPVAKGGDNISGVYNPKGQIIVSENFESGGWDTSFWNPSWCNFDYSCRVPENPQGSGGVFRTEFRAENCNDRPTMGAELASPEIPYNEQWLGMRIYFDSELFGPDSTPVILVQHHGKPDFDLGESWRNPVAALYYYSGGELLFRYRGSKDRVTPKIDGKWAYTEDESIKLGAPTLDAWNSFVIHTVWDATGNNGLVEIWHDGKLYRLENINISFNDERKPYLKFGQYNFTCQSDDPVRVSFHDDLKISVGSDAGFCDVVPPGSVMPANIQCQ